MTDAATVAAAPPVEAPALDLGALHYAVRDAVPEVDRQVKHLRTPRPADQRDVAALVHACRDGLADGHTSTDPRWREIFGTNADVVQHAVRSVWHVARQVLPRAQHDALTATLAGRIVAQLQAVVDRNAEREREREDAGPAAEKAKRAMKSHVQQLVPLVEAWAEGTRKAGDAFGAGHIRHTYLNPLERLRGILDR